MNKFCVIKIGLGDTADRKLVNQDSITLIRKLKQPTSREEVYLIQIGADSYYFNEFIVTDVGLIEAIYYLNN